MGGMSRFTPRPRAANMPGGSHGPASGRVMETRSGGPPIASLASAAMSSDADAIPGGHQVVCTGTVRVELPPRRAIELFTPSGERTWVEGWDPVFPAGEGEGETAPGSVSPRAITVR